MIISHSHRYIFIKSEKTAGTSVEAALSKHCTDSDIVTPLGDYWFNRGEKGEWIHSAMNAEGFFQHDPAAEVKRKVAPEIWNDYFKLLQKFWQPYLDGTASFDDAIARMVSSL